MTEREAGERQSVPDAGEDRPVPSEAKRRRRVLGWPTLALLVGLVVLACWIALRTFLSPDNLRAQIKAALSPYVRGRIELGDVRFDLLRGVVIDHPRIYDGLGREAEVVVEAREAYAGSRSQVWIEELAEQVRQAVGL